MTPILNGTEAEAATLWRFFESTLLPEEKQKIKEAEVEIAKKLRAEGSVSIPGLGQKAYEFPRALVVRLSQAYPDWRGDQAFIDSILADNPGFCAPGYKPKPNPLRNGITGGWGLKS